MSEVLECSNCGAVLLEADLFCGECGAPRPAVALPSEPSSVDQAATESTAAPPRVSPSPASEPARPTSRQGPWHIIVIALSVLSVLLCVVGVIAFLLFGLTESDVASPQENWLYSTICCLVPIAGTGVVVGLAALGIWLVRLRKR
jgi:hypothetical protein